MDNEIKKPGAQPFVAFEIALEVIKSLRVIVSSVRRYDSKVADQIVAAASSVAANLAEGSRRVGKDRLHLFRIASGSANEVRAHVLVAQAWGWVTEDEVEQALRSLDRELALLWGLTH